MIMEKQLLEEVKARALKGIPATIDEALALDAICTTDELCDVANEVRIKHCGNKIDTCSIVNARSGRCTEDCKWCAQAARHSTGIDEYDIIPDDQLMEAVKLNASQGVHRFSMVTSGRKISPADVRRFCDMYRRVAAASPMKLCASMGLLTKDELASLREAGVQRYHCNLETAESFFGTLCTTHSHADKLRTIRAAREVGMEVCSGGIIGMGETMRQRLELAEQAREAGAMSIPVNVLQPIKGTPLEGTPLIGEDEVVRSVALMKLVAPLAILRFAGGRARLSHKSMLRMLHGGISGAIVGDMLTTIGNKMVDDHTLFAMAGFEE